MAKEILLSNTLSRKKEKFKARKENEVNIYFCGPTVYGFTHVGNAFAALSADLVHRVFKLAGYTVNFISNITDIDDKIIKLANEEKVDTKVITEKFTKHYLDEMQEMGILEPQKRPRATESVPEMIAMIETLIKKDHAYASETPFGNDVYFRVESCKDYGKLSNKKVDELEAGARIEIGESKEHPADFTLWKASKEGEPSWESPWGDGRPGWHIECSAMIHAHFKGNLDIHMGGLDLIFPHHENEIAQSECCFDEIFAPYWLHNGMLTIEKEKMSKSVGNIFKTKDFFNKFGAEVFRLFILQHHFKSPIDFSDEAILRTEAMLERIYSAQLKGTKKADVTLTADEKSPLFELSSKIEAALFDDFNSAKALGHFMKAMRYCFKNDQEELWNELHAASNKYLKEIYAFNIDEAEKMLQEIKKRRLDRMGVDEAYAEWVKEKLKEREEQRKAKNFEAADTIRKELESKNVLIMDGPDGSSWTVARKI